VRSAAFSLAVGLVLADSSVAVLALPAIYRELEVDLGDLHWVLTTFNLVLALVPTPAARVTRAALAQSVARNSPLSSKSPALAAVFSAMHAAS
jgi:hypothetical protein